jgi:hypothetical protein
MSNPRDGELYERIKTSVYKQYPKHSAYRSGLLVQQYKKAYQEKHGDSNAYVGKKQKTEGLTRWFAENWKNQRGEVGYKTQSDIYRPTKRITKETPKTFSELSQSEIKQARKQKASTGRVNKFKASN